MGGKGPGDFNQKDIGFMVDCLLEGIDVSDELKKKLEDVRGMNEFQTILQDYPDVLKQIQENRIMRGPGMQKGNGAPPNGSNSTNGQTFQPPTSSTDQPPQNEVPGDQPSTQ